MHDNIFERRNKMDWCNFEWVVGASRYNPVESERLINEKRGTIAKRKNTRMPCMHCRQSNGRQKAFSVPKGGIRKWESIHKPV